MHMFLSSPQKKKQKKTRDEITGDKRQTDFPSEEIMTMILNGMSTYLDWGRGEVGINETSMVVYHFHHIEFLATFTNHFIKAR